MRIAYIITRASVIGGAYVHVRDLSKYMMDQGHDVKVFVGGDGPFIEHLAERNVPYHQLEFLDRAINPKKDLAALKELKAALGAFKPDLISCHTTKAGMLGRLAGHKLGIPALYTAHGWTFVPGIGAVQRKIILAIEKYCRKKGPHIICVCQDDKDLAIQAGVGPADFFTVVHNGMPDDDTRANPGESNRIVCIARMCDQKDHGTLIRACAELKDLDFKLDLVGGGELKPEFEALVKELGLEEQVVFHGSQKNVRPFLENAALFALITNYEGFPRSTLEAMRAGLPIVVTDVNGCKEAIEEGKCGFSVPHKDVTALAAKLRTLLTNAEMRRSFGVESRKRYEALFTFDHMIEKTKAVYAKILKKPV